MHVEDCRCFEELFCHLGLNVIIIDDGQEAHSLDPGVHDQMRRGFSSLGVGVMDMVVKGQLIPFLRHFQKMVFFEFGPDNAGLARRRDAKVMGQEQLGCLVLPVAD